ncbi:MAG TPA: glycosyltransferase, partial [Phycisphaerae bacterium]|nr:glycosyltransferase [Phycisphaerae bacterium]
MLCFASYAEVTERVKTKPVEYLLDLEKTIAKRDASGIWYDTSLPAYREMLKKYRPQPKRRPVVPQADGDHWQAWREGGGHWVRDGWLKPGYSADPPWFNPLPGETLRSPGFPAAEFAGPVKAEPVDVVVALGTGSRLDDIELRYALRSVEKHLENLGQVWVVGHRPAWLRGVRHLPAPDDLPTKDGNIIEKLRLACRQPDLSERFVFLSDDQVLLRPLAFSQLGSYHFGDLRARTDWETTWLKHLRHTRDTLAAAGKTMLHGDTHAPIPIEKAKFLAMCEGVSYRGRPGLCVGTAYLNWAGATMRPMGQRKATTHGRSTDAELRACVAGRWFLGYAADGFTPGLRKLLDEMFPEPSRFEHQPVMRVKSTGPTLSIIVPTIGRPSLKRTLDSIRSQQLVDGDEVLVVQDGPPEEATRRMFEESGLPGRYLALDRHYGDFGATPRNYGMSQARGENLGFMDDDDTYKPDALAAIRRAIARHPGRPLMFRMERPGWDSTLWASQIVRYANVSTPMFVVPNRSNQLG